MNPSLEEHQRRWFWCPAMEKVAISSNVGQWSGIKPTSIETNPE